MMHITEYLCAHPKLVIVAGQKCFMRNAELVPWSFVRRREQVFPPLEAK